MKFYCDACNTKYSIPDEKVHGKVLKVRCKSCGNIITVKEQEAPLATGVEPTALGSRPSPPPAPGGPKVPPNNWHYSVNGQSSGPYALKALREKFENGSLGDEAYVWHESLVQWKPVREVPAFHDSLAKGQAIKPRAKTIGFTGPLEAIKADQAPKGKQEGFVPDLGVKKSPDIGSKKDEKRKEPRQDRLEALREKLKNDVPEPNKRSLAAGLAPKPVEKKPELPTPTFDSPDDTASITFPDTILDSKPEVENTKPEPAPEKPKLPAFELKPFSAALFEETPSDTGDVEPEDQVLDDWAKGAELESPQDSGLIPFFDSVPKLESSHAPDSQVPTGSLLIQLDSIKREGRKKKLGFMLGALVVVGISAGAIGYYFAGKAPEERPFAEVTKKEPVRVPVEKVYSKGKLSNMGIELEEEVIPADPSLEELAMPEKPAENAEAQVAEKSAQVPTKAGVEDRPEPKKVVATKVEPNAEPQAVAKAEEKPPEEDKPVTAQSVLSYTSPTAARSGSTAINRPEDTIGAAASSATTLSKDAARDGFRIIRQSVMQCRERHMRRGATLDANKIHIKITVEPTGSVSKYGVQPASVANTEFDICMRSHMDRWKFARWQGVATEITSSFVMQ